MAYNQNEALLGSNGLIPVKNFLRHVKKYTGNEILQKFLTCPSILMFLDEANYDHALNLIALSGITISVLIILQGAANMLIMTTLWILYHSLVNVGQTW